MPVCDGRRAGLDVADADLAGEVAGGDFAVTVHEHDQRLPVVVLHDQRLDYRVHPRLARGQIPAYRLFFVGIQVVGPLHVMLAQDADGLVTGGLAAMATTGTESG